MMIKLTNFGFKINRWAWPLVVVFTGLALFPFGWLAQRSPLISWIVYGIFRSDIAHILAHLGIFMGIAFGLLHLFPRLSAHVGIFFGVMSALGLAQEFLQLFSFKHRGLTEAELFDLGIDLVGAFLVFWLCKQRTKLSL